MTTLTLPRDTHTPVKTRRRQYPQVRTGHYEETITGRFRAIPVRQLALAWWCYLQGHISKRELRIFFAAQEMAERRRYGRTQNPKEKPVFKIGEIQDLVGGRNNDRAARDLLTDVKNLGKMGLVKITQHKIAFAKSVDELSVGEGSAEEFDEFMENIPNRRRTVPVPRRVLRFLAAGLGRAETAYVIAALIRSLYWHKESGLFRTDGRIKGSWVGKTFGVSRRGVTDARNHLITLGWLRPLEVPQWASNKFGVHDVVDVHWNLKDVAENEKIAEEEPSAPSRSGEATVDNSVVETDELHIVDTEFASPRGQFDTHSASPCLNKNTSTNTLNTRRLGHFPTLSDSGGREKKIEKAKARPNIRDVKLYDFEDTDRLLELHRQAVQQRLWGSGRAGELDFLSLANRAYTHGKKAGGLFFWLLTHKKTEYITMVDEEVASARLRERFYGKDTRDKRQRRNEDLPPEEELSKEEMFVEMVIHTARQHKIKDPYRIAKKGEGWTRQEWDDAYLNYQIGKKRRCLLTNTI